MQRPSVGHPSARRASVRSTGTNWSRSTAHGMTGASRTPRLSAITGATAMAGCGARRAGTRRAATVSMRRCHGTSSRPVSASCRRRPPRSGRSAHARCRSAGAAAPGEVRAAPTIAAACGASVEREDVDLDTERPEVVNLVPDEAPELGLGRRRVHVRQHQHPKTVSVRRGRHYLNPSAADAPSRQPACITAVESAQLLHN